MDAVFTVLVLGMLLHSVHSCIFRNEVFAEVALLLKLSHSFLFVLTGLRCWFPITYGLKILKNPQGWTHYLSGYSHWSAAVEGCLQITDVVLALCTIYYGYWVMLGLEKARMVFLYLLGARMVLDVHHAIKYALDHRSASFAFSFGLVYTLLLIPTLITFFFYNNAGVRKKLFTTLKSGPFYERLRPDTQKGKGVTH